MNIFVIMFLFLYVTLWKVSTVMTSLYQIFQTYKNNFRIFFKMLVDCSLQWHLISIMPSTKVCFKIWKQTKDIRSQLRIVWIVWWMFNFLKANEVIAVTSTQTLRTGTMSWRNTSCQFFTSFPLWFFLNGLKYFHGMLL